MGHRRRRSRQLAQADLVQPADHRHDRALRPAQPNDQITGGNIQFSDGSSITVGTLPNNGSAYPLTFTAKTVTSLQLNITSVSATTGNIGLAEIQAYHSGPERREPAAGGQGGGEPDGGGRLDRAAGRLGQLRP